ncbi:MAG: NAD(P)/FAD-dependent oxidoreductase [Burkholderiaceae bacterium]|nr:NAD(P)/FAD-dependent oxidoreductase [Burkholderiaceae bacterium]
MQNPAQNHYDVLIIGAGLSGIGMACHVVTDFPHWKVAILERRQAIGGTWDLFRYPGIRSDSDMLSFGYGFRPWNELQTLADGPSIRQYVADTAREYGVDKKIQYGLKITAMDWSSKDCRWSVHAIEEASGLENVFTCNFLANCTGYYSYDQGFTPDFEGVDAFKGKVIHPQHWPEDLNYSGKRVVVIGSGATAVTLVPAMADNAEHVTMLQRSPGYIFSLPATDGLARVLSKFMPKKWAYALARQRRIMFQQVTYKIAKRYPKQAKSFLLNSVRKQLDGHADMSHFTPKYNPWDERLCAVPDGDLFKAIKRGKASVVTDRIERFTEKGLRLQSGRELEADIIITATGLQMQSFGGIALRVDGEEKHINERMTYKGVLLEGLPNLAWIFGYVNASWTLKAEIASNYFCRLLQLTTQSGFQSFTPRAPEGEATNESMWCALQSGYVLRARPFVPRQGRNLPWKVLNDYKRDRKMLLDEPVNDEALEFRKANAG